LKNSVFRRFVKSDISQKTTLDKETANFVGTNNQRLIGIAPFAQYEAKVYPLDLMQDVISQLAENPAYKILLLEEGRKK
jgi:hypothetical protein